MKRISCYRIDLREQRERVISFLQICTIQDIVAIRDKKCAIILDKEKIKKAIEDATYTEIDSVYVSALPYGLTYYEVFLILPKEKYENLGEHSIGDKEEPTEDSRYTIFDTLSSTIIDTLSSTDELLDSRGKEYKIPFKTNATALGSIVKSLLDNYRHTDDYVLGEFIYMQIKLLRHCGNPKHKDTMEDLKGYSELISRNANTAD